MNIFTLKSFILLFEKQNETIKRYKENNLKFSESRQTRLNGIKTTLKCCNFTYR